MRTLRAPRVSFLVICLALLAFASEATASEPFFPQVGSRAYDVLHYDSNLFFKPKGREIVAGERIAAVANTELKGFSLDLFGLQVKSVTVGDQLARFSRADGKLLIRPAVPIAAGERFVVHIRYRGRPRTIIDSDVSEEGWVRTDDGAMAVGEPLGTAAWLACNDVPWDKATFDVAVSVPRPLAAISNGRLAGFVRQPHQRRRYLWSEAQPMSPYLAVIDIGRGKLTESKVDGLPYWTLVDPRMARQARPVLAQLPRIIRFEGRLFGGYPFDSAGSIVDYAPRLGYALESQTRPIYAFVPDASIVVHETAHEWFGDSVGLKRWPGIWLNEGFATWVQWYYAESHGGRSAQEIFDRLDRVPASNKRFWDPPPGRPGSPRLLFAPSVYVRGGMALEALRLKIGTGPMLQVLRSWAEEHRYGSGDIEEFTALAERISGQNLDPLFHRWLYKRGKP